MHKVMKRKKIISSYSLNFVHEKVFPWKHYILRELQIIHKYKGMRCGIR